jgi:hypothetical protein
MKRLALLVLVLVGGCGSGSSQDFTVNNLVLHVSDQLYVSRPNGYFCNAIAPGQIKLSFLDYSPACTLDQKAGAANPRDPGIEHVQLDIILGTGAHPNNMNPYSLSKVDCDIGPGDNGTATFYHFPANGMTPDATISVDSGTLQINQYDTGDVQPLKGTFDLTFGASKVAGTFDALACNT